MQTCASSLMRTDLVQLLVFPKSVQARNQAKIHSLATLQLPSSWLEPKHKGTWKLQINKKDFFKCKERFNFFKFLPIVCQFVFKIEVGFKKFKKVQSN